MDGMMIGELARLAEVGVETVRYYERRGLLDEPPRRASGYRIYPSEALSRLHFIRRAKVLGFTLEEIRGILALPDDSVSKRHRMRARAEAKIEDIDRRIRDLASIRDALVKLTKQCERGAKLDPCPILAALEGALEMEVSS